MTGHLITNGRILDGTGREPFAGAVRVDGNRIAEVAPGSVTARLGCCMVGLATDAIYVALAGDR